MLTDKEKQDYLEFSRIVATKAGKLTLQYYGHVSDIQRKEDNTPVTIADKMSEEFIRSEIQSKFPDHSILGEEFQNVESESDFRWVIDPIDGTSSFVRKVPLYTVLLALLYKDKPVLGIINAPALEETVYAAEGLGCYYNGTRCSVSKVEHLKEAWVQVTDFAELQRRRPEFTQRLLSEAYSCRTWGDAYGYLLVATGRVDVMIDPIMQPWDIAPLEPIITEAGGVFTNLEGHPNPIGTSSLACNKELHESIMKII